MILENWKMHENCNISSNLVLEINQKNMSSHVLLPFPENIFLTTLIKNKPMYNRCLTNPAN